MTTEDLFEDMKQFINAKIDGLDDKIDGVRDELKSDISDLTPEISDVRSDIADVDAKVDTILEVLGADVVKIEKKVENHEKRIAKLEIAKAA